MQQQPPVLAELSSLEEKTTEEDLLPEAGVYDIHDGQQLPALLHLLGPRPRPARLVESQLQDKRVGGVEGGAELGDQQPCLAPVPAGELGHSLENIDIANKNRMNW